MPQEKDMARSGAASQNSLLVQEGLEIGHFERSPGRKPGIRVGVELSPVGAKDTAQSLSPLPGLGVSRQAYPGLAPGATFLSRSAAGTASSAISKMANLQRLRPVGLAFAPLIR